MFGFLAKAAVAGVVVYVVNKKLQETDLLEKAAVAAPVLLERGVAFGTQVLNSALTSFAQAQEAAKTAAAQNGGV